MRWPRHTEQSQLIGELLHEYYPYFEDFTLDSAMLIDERIVALRRSGRLRALTDLFDELATTTTTDEDVIQELMNHLDMSGLPDGTGYRAWLLAVRARLHEALDDESAVPADAVSEDHRPIRDQRVSWFPDPAMQDVVADAVLDLHAEQGRAWADDPSTSGWKRQHYYADLSDLRERIGDFGFTAPYGDGDLRHLPDLERTEPATGAVVVLNLGALDGEITGFAAYPERRLDTTLRAAYPDLCHWFGGFFYQKAGIPMSSMGAACRSTEDPARSRVRDQLTMLLHEDDDSMRRIVEACGSYVLPQSMRHWVDRTLWRLDAFPWLGPDGKPILD